MIERLLLPPVVCGCTGIEMNIYFTNVFTCINPSNYVFKFSCPVGRCDTDRWHLVPGDDDIGNHQAQLQVLDDNGVVAQAKCRIEIFPANKCAGKKLRLLMIGDSYTDQSHYPTHLHTLCVQNGMELTMLGTNVPLELCKVPGQMIDYPPEELLHGVRHEGWGGWTAYTFLNRKEPILRDTYYHWDCASPFLNEQGTFDFQAYLDRHCDGLPPDVIMISLGGNDLITVNDENYQQCISNYVNNMCTLQARLQKNAPNAIFGIGLEPYGTMEQTAWGKSMGCKFFAWDKRRFAPVAYARLAEAFANVPNCYMMPMYHALDPIHAYKRALEKCFEESTEMIERGQDALHPNSSGYRQGANSSFAWLLSVL